MTIAKEKAPWRAVARIATELYGPTYYAHVQIIRSHGNTVLYGPLSNNKKVAKTEIERLRAAAEAYAKAHGRTLEWEVRP